jgi:hypothetical protein
MTYSASNKIIAPDINGYITNNQYNLNRIWSTGDGSYGYGLTTQLNEGAGYPVYQSFPLVAINDPIKFTHWAQLVKYISQAATHQGMQAYLQPMTFSDENGNPGNTKRIRTISDSATTAIANNLKLITDYRLRAATQGSDIAYTATSSQSWKDKLTVTFTVTFSNHDLARYFFNSGGQFKFSAAHAGTVNNTINNLISNICSDSGTMVISSDTTAIGNIAYTGFTKVGGSNRSSSQIASNSYGFNHLSSGSYTADSSLTLFTQYGETRYRTYGAGYSTNSTGYATGTTLALSVKYNKAGRFIFTIVLDEVPNNATVNAGTKISLVVKQPAATYLQNTSNWANPAVTQVVSAQ